MKKYYIEINNKRKGPFDLPDLIKQDVFPNTMVWHEGLTNWKPASDFPELTPVIKTPKGNSFKMPDFAKYKVVIIGAIILIISAMTVIYFPKPGSTITSNSEVSKENSSDNRDYSESKTEKDQMKEDANNANPQDDEVKRKLQQETEIENNKRYIRNNWFNYFKISRSGYTAEGLGGISDLRVYFENKTGYLIDNVNAQIDIYTANGYVYKTEYIEFSNVPANGFEVYNVPYSPRGSSVSEPRIISIGSSILNFCFLSHGTRTNEIVDSSDPYRCAQ